jgi:hypothetical protein
MTGKIRRTFQRSIAMPRRLAFASFLSALLAAVLAGCGDTNAPKTSPKDSAGTNSAAKADDLPGLKELDEADRKLAERQKSCPVSGSLLGTADMGKPYKMTVKGRVIFLCCDGCKGAVDKDPDGILKKVDALLANK